MCLAIPGRIISISAGDGTGATALVDFGGVEREVSLACLPEAEIGQYVLVHVGIALEIVSDEEAQEVFCYLEKIGELAEQIGESQ